MMFLALLKEAWVSIGASRLRTFLAVLGIVIGTGSVVLMMAIGAGSRRNVEENIAKLGSNLLIVTPGSTEIKGLRNASIPSFEFKDVDAMAQVPSVIAVAPSTYGRSFQIANGKRNWNTQVIGTTGDFFTVRNWEFAAGEAFTPEDIRLLRRNAVIGMYIVDKLFPDYSENPAGVIGRSLRIESTSFRIAGVLKNKGSGFDGKNQDDGVYLPITTAKATLWGHDYTRGLAQMVYVQAASADMLDEVSEDISVVLRRHRKIHGASGDDFTVRNLTALMQVAADTRQAFSFLLGAIASISLIVGGIGIMNIMLVTVTERTREIGIRKAIGATERQILLQFLMEAVIISCIGSLLGLFVGFTGGWSAEIWFGATVDYTLWIVLIVTVLALVVGIISGGYPAYKAARMQPIEALRMV